MTARLVLPPGAPEEEWLAARRQGVTASEIAAVLGISPFESAFNLYYAKRGEIPANFDNDRLSLGHHLEPWIAERFAEARADVYLTAPAGLWASTERDWQLATPDGLIFDVPVATVECCGDWNGSSCWNCPERSPLAVWEGKTYGTYEDWGEDGTDEIPAHYRAQVLWQMDVVGCQVGYVSCLFLSTQQIRTYEIAYDADDVALMRKRGLEFWEQVQAGDVPELDAHAATTGALKALHPDVEDGEEVTVPADVAEHYRSAKAAVKFAQEDADLAENRLRDAMGDAKVAVDPAGQKVASRSIYERKPYSVGPAHIDRLNPARKKKETAA